MNSDSGFDALDLLLIDLFEVGLDPARMDQLGVLLAADPEARRRYIDRSTINALLEWQAGRVDFSMRQSLPSQPRIDPSRSMVMPAIRDSQASDQAEIEPVEAAPPVASDSADAVAPPQRAPTRRWMRLLSLAAAILIVVSGSVVLTLRWHGSSSQVAMLKNSEGAEWEPGMAPKSASAAIAAHEQLSLLSGSISITFNGGASVMIQAPAQFSADTPSTMTIAAGRMSAVVPFEARGFTVTTPELVVKDLGTEFGIRCGPDVQTEVAVFKGSVQATAQSDHSSPRLLVAGDTASVSSGALAVISGGASLQKVPQHGQPINLPLGLLNADVGASVAGSAQYVASGGIWTVNGVGTNIFHMADQFHFLAKPVPGNTTMICRLVTPTTGPDGRRRDFSKCGIMFRESLNPGSRFVDLVRTQGHGVQMIVRDETNGDAYLIGPRNTPMNVAVWLRLTRAGNEFTAAYSRDGSTWTTLGAHVTDVGANALAGLVVSSGDDHEIGTATFTDVAIKSDLPAK